MRVLGILLAIVAGLLGLVLVVLERGVGLVRHVVGWSAQHPRSAGLLALALLAAGGMVFLLFLRGDGGESDGEDAGGMLVVDLPTLMVPELVSVGGEPDGQDEQEPEALPPTVVVPAFLQTRVARGSGPADAASSVVVVGLGGDGENPAGVDVSGSPELRDLVERLNEVRGSSGAPELLYRYNRAALAQLRDIYTAGSPVGIFPLMHAGWQAYYSAGGGYLPSHAYVYVCLIEECDVGDLVDSHPGFISPSVRVYTGAYLRDRGRNVYLLALATRFSSLEAIPPMGRNGFVHLRGSTDGGANVGSMKVALHYRGLDEDGEDYGEPLARITNPDLPVVGDSLELPAGRWETSGQSFDIEVDLSSYFVEDGRYTLVLRASTGRVEEYIAAYTVELGRNRFGVLNGDGQAGQRPPTPTPEPTRAVGPGKLSQPGFNGLRVSQLAEQGWSAGQDVLVVACRADEAGPPERWAEGVPFTADGHYRSDSELVVVLVPGEVYPTVGKCHRLAVRFDGLRLWDFCRRPGSCGVNEGRQVAAPHYVMTGTEHWQELDPVLRCDSPRPVDGEHGCWRSEP